MINLNQPVKKAWTFASSSGSGTYQTILYESGDTSCNCMGWTRREANDGSRSCKHTRMVDMGTADAECTACTEDKGSARIKQAPKKAKKTQPVIETEPEDDSLGTVRKISWQ